MQNKIAHTNVFDSNEGVTISLYDLYPFLNVLDSQRKDNCFSFTHRNGPKPIEKISL